MRVDLLAYMWEKISKGEKVVLVSALAYQNIEQKLIKPRIGLDHLFDASCMISFVSEDEIRGSLIEDNELDGRIIKAARAYINQVNSGERMMTSVGEYDLPGLFGLKPEQLPIHAVTFEVMGKEKLAFLSSAYEHARTGKAWLKISAVNHYEVNAFPLIFKIDQADPDACMTKILKDLGGRLSIFAENEILLTYSLPQRQSLQGRLILHRDQLDLSQGGIDSHTPSSDSGDTTKFQQPRIEVQVNWSVH